MTSLRGAAVLALVVLTADRAMARTQSRLSSASQKAIERGARAAAEDIVRAGGALGAVVAVKLREEGRQVATAGFVERERQTPIDAQRHFQIGSLTKMFTAAATLRLLKDGALRLDERIKGRVSGYAGGAEVTIRQLLNHTSGIGDAVELFWPAKIYPTNRFTFDELLTISRLQGQQYPPGARFKYNETGMNILGRITELESGGTLAEFLRRRITGPLGMRDTYSGTGERWPGAKMARAYFNPAGSDSAIETTTQGDFNLSWAFAAGDMISTADDLLKWGRALLDPANPVGISLRDLTAEPIARQTPGPDTGYGFGIAEHSLAGRTVWGHGGHVYGYLSFFIVDPVADIEIVILTNLDGDPKVNPSDVYSRRILPAATALLHLTIGVDAARDPRDPR